MKVIPQGHSPFAGLLKRNPSNICAVFYQISTDSALARSRSDSWAWYNLSHAICYSYGADNKTASWSMLIGPLSEANESDDRCAFCSETETIEYFLLKCKRNTNESHPRRTLRRKINMHISGNDSEQPQ